MDLTIQVTDKQSSTIAEFHEYLDTVTKEDALESIKNLAQMESEDWFRIGMVLSSYRKSKGDEEFKSLLHYSEENLQINSRKAYYLISIHDKLVESNITPSQVSQMGWTKLKEIAHLLTPDNVDYWLGVCNTHTTKQIITMLKSNATTNVAKAGSIEEALEDVVMDTVDDPIVKVAVTLEDLPEGQSGIMVGYDFSKDSDNPTTGTIDEGKVTSYAKYTTNIVPPTAEYPENIIDVVTTEVTTPDVMASKATVLESVVPEVAPESAIMTVDQLALKLKVYDLAIVIKTITEIFPHLKITVTEAQNATSFD